MRLRNQLAVLFFTAMSLPAIATAQAVHSAKAAQAVHAAPVQRLTPIQFQGEGLFLQNCSFCHFEHKMGSQSTVHGNVQNPKSTEPGIPICPDLKTLMHKSPAPTDRALRLVIQKGSPFKMPGYQYGLEPAEIDSLNAYLHTF